MAKKIIIISLFISIIYVSIANADLILKVNDENPTDIPLMLQGIGPYQITLDGNTIIEPNDIRIEAVGGTLTAMPDVNNQYSFQYDNESTSGLINIISNVDMTIDDINIPADTTIYELFIFSNSDANITGTCGNGLADLLPPEENEEEQNGNNMEISSEQSDSNSEETINNSQSSSIYDPTWDLNPDGIIDFKDFSVFAIGWQTTYNINDLSSFCSAFATIDCCIDINNIPDPTNNLNWNIVIFTGTSGSCGTYDCWYEEDYSDYYYDGCGYRLYQACEETPDFDYTCAFNYWWYGLRVGLCVYTCGWNDFQVLKNNGGCHFIFSRHRTRDQLTSGCDEGTIGYYNWQVVVTYFPNSVRTGYCCQSTTASNDTWGWQPNEGQTGPCKYIWW